MALGAGAGMQAGPAQTYPARTIHYEWNGIKTVVGVTLILLLCRRPQPFSFGSYELRTYSIIYSPQINGNSLQHDLPIGDWVAYLVLNLPGDVLSRDRAEHFSGSGLGGCARPIIIAQEDASGD